MLSADEAQWEAECEYAIPHFAIMDNSYSLDEMNRLIAWLDFAKTSYKTFTEYMEKEWGLR